MWKKHSSVCPWFEKVASVLTDQTIKYSSLFELIMNDFYDSPGFSCWSNMIKDKLLYGKEASAMRSCCQIVRENENQMPFHFCILLQLQKDIFQMKFKRLKEKKAFCIYKSYLLQFTIVNSRCDQMLRCLSSYKKGHTFPFLISWRLNMYLAFVTTVLLSCMLLFWTYAIDSCVIRLMG